MSSSTLFRLSGVVLILGTLLSIVGTVAQFGITDNPANSMWTVGAMLGLASLMLLIIGLTGLYARFASHTKMLGFLGFVLLIGALFLAIGRTAILGIMLPWLTQVAPTAANSDGPPAMGTFFILEANLLLVGGILFGIATFRVRVFPNWARWMGIVLIAVAVLSVVANFTNMSDLLTSGSMDLLFVALAGLGWVLLSEQREAPASAPTASSAASTLEARS
jgi:hypothetical protein